VGHGFTGCGKTRYLSFRGLGSPEESAFFFDFTQEQIPRFARDDSFWDFFRTLFSRDICLAGLMRL